MLLTEQIFLSILQKVLWGGSIVLPHNTDWLGVLNMAARHKCLHAFAIWTKTHRIVTPYDQQLQSNIFMTLQHQGRLNHLTCEVIDLLSQYQIPATLIKGYSLSGLYPDTDMRDFGDVDIYVGQKDYTRAAQIITDAYPNAHWHSDLQGGIHFILVLDEQMDRVIELHRVTMEFTDHQANELFQRFTHKHLDNPTNSLNLYGKTISVPSSAYNALYLFMHAWHHFESSGIGLRQLGDWALSLHHAHQSSTTEEWDALLCDIDEILTALHLKTAWQTFGHILVQYLNLSADDFPFYTYDYKKRAQRLLRQILRDGHASRPCRFNILDITLMRCFPFQRPQSCRILQILYTTGRILFQTWQMCKLFPDYAWHELKSKISSRFISEP